jgi:AraC family transcriptional regulator
MTERTAAETLDKHIRGRLVADGGDRSMKSVIAQIFVREREQDGFLVPAVAEPLIVWILKGTAIVEERELGGEWTAARVAAGDFFITDSDAPYELRWNSLDNGPFEVMHLHLGLPLMERAGAEVLGSKHRPLLSEVSGARDDQLARYIALIAGEIAGQSRPSPLYLESVAQALAIRLVQHYRDEARDGRRRRNALPAYRLRRVTELMEQSLGEEFDLARYADVASMSIAHFSRQFKHATGLAPSQYFIRLRIRRARQLLRETDQPIISVGMEVGYSSPSHFAQVFRKETGVSPRSYRRA